MTHASLAVTALLLACSHLTVLTPTDPDYVVKAAFVLAWQTRLGDSRCMREAVSRVQVEYVDGWVDGVKGRTGRTYSPFVVKVKRMPRTALAHELIHAVLWTCDTWHDADATHSAPPGPWTKAHDDVEADVTAYLRTIGM